MNPLLVFTKSYQIKLRKKPIFDNARSPRVRIIIFIPYSRHIYYEYFRIALGFALFCKLTHTLSLVCGSCSSAQDFASGFLQIPPHGGHPCLQLAVGAIYSGSGYLDTELQKKRDGLIN